MNVYIYCAGHKGTVLRDKLIDEYNIDVKGFLDTYKKDEFEGTAIYNLRDVKETDAIVIANSNHKTVVEIVDLLKKNGKHNVFWHLDFVYPRIVNSDFFKNECVSCDKWGNFVIPHLEYHIVDNCNLNCAGCTHFSPLFEGTEESFESKIKGIDLLLEKFTCIAGIDVLGGEPLLSEKLDMYLIELRKRLPNSFINLFTNGLLIPRMTEDTFKVIRDNNIFISITEYKPTHNMIEKIVGVLEREKIPYTSTGYNSRDLFNVPISTNSKSIYPQKCISRGCFTLADGKIALCPTLMYVNKFNEFYDENLPVEGIINLNCNMTGDEILNELEKEVPLCKHCIEKPMEWHVCDKKRSISEFAVFD